MSVYLQFDSLARSNPYIKKNLGAGAVWVPNDNYNNTTVSPFAPYQENKNLIQTPANYRVFYRELNSPNNLRTIGFLAHCKERVVNLNFSVEFCTVTIPASALVRREDSDGNVTYSSVLDEPYLYVRVMPINHSEGDLVYSNNPAADEASFVVWCDKLQLGSEQSPPLANPVERPNPEASTLSLNTAKWVIYKSCMVTIMRLDLQAEEWQIRIYDRYGNDIVLAESDNGGAGFTGDTPPAVDPNLQTMVLMGIKPNYPL